MSFLILHTLPLVRVTYCPANTLYFQAGDSNNDMADQLRRKQCELLELQKKKLELELLATKKKIEEQEREINQQANNVTKQKLEKLAATKMADVKRVSDSIAMLSEKVGDICLVIIKNV
jgi:hypothetical protein